MPSSVNAAGRRKVRCPKCTALLTEPQTQIYECPICLTLLLAKGNPSTKLWENRLHNSSGDADEIQQTPEGGSKLEKATLINESSKGILQQKEIESDLDFDRRSRNSQEGNELSDLDNQSLSGISFSKQKTEPAKDLTSKNNALVSNTPPDTPRHRKSQHMGEISPRGGSGRRLSELDSASHSESEVDSSIWSSENANASEATEFSSTVSSFEASSHADGSSERLNTSRSSFSSGAVGNDGALSLQQQGNEFEMRKASEARSSGRGAKEEIEHEERHHPYEVSHEEDSPVEERRYLESRIRNGGAAVLTSSGKSVLEEGHKAKDKNDGELVNSSDALAGSTNFKSHLSNAMDSTPKESVSGDSKISEDVGISKVGKFGLFDLSVFGIYSEDMYSELRRGKAAHYSKLSETSSDGEGRRSTGDDNPKSYSHEVAAQSPSREQDCAENQMVENIVEVQKSSTVPESITDGTQTKEGSCGEVPFKEQGQDMDATVSSSVGQEIGDGGNIGDVGPFPNSFVDSDTLADARYGDHLAVRDLSLEMGSSVDVSFGDWRLQQVVKPPPQKSHEHTYVDAGSVYERGMLDIAVGESSESSWDDEEELTFSSMSKEESKPKGAPGTEKEAEAPPRSIRKSISRSRAKALSENPALPFRTTAMQKFLQRNEHEGTVHTLSQESIKADLELYEASYEEQYTPALEKTVNEAADQTITPVPETNVDETSYAEEGKPVAKSVAQELVDTEMEAMVHQHKDLFTAHSMRILNAGSELVPPTLFSGKEEDTQTILTEGAPSRKDLTTGDETLSLTPLSRKEKEAQMAVEEDLQSTKGFYSVKSPERDAGLHERDRTGTQVTDLDEQNVDYFKHDPANKAGSAPGKPVSLRWKVKGRSSTQSLSSTEDDGAYGMESEAGSGPERDFTTKQGVGLTDGRIFPETEAQLGLGQNARVHHQPAQWPRSSNIDVERQKHGSGELVASRRTARTRGANARLSSQESFEQADAGRVSDLKTFGRSGLERSENVPALQSHLHRSMLDQGYGIADYNSDHSSRSQDVLSRIHFNDGSYLSNPYGLPVAGSTQAYPLTSHGSVPRAPLQEPGFSHSAHHCVSPACSLCMQQQQYYMQPPQMISNMMMHPCLACASQSSAAGYHQPMHHGAHSHHMHGSTFSNLSLPAHSQRQNRSNIHQGHPLPRARSPKLYPPLPGKDAPPYVLCKHCNQLLQVPGYLPPTSKPVQKLQCGSCEKISKFSVSLQAVSPPTDKKFWPGGLAFHASDSNNHPARDKRRTDTSSIHSFDRIPASGPAVPVQNSYRTVGHTSRHGSQQDWVEDRVSLQSSAPGTPQTEIAGLRHHARPMTGGVPEQYRSFGRHVESEHFHNNTGAYSEGYLSSSPSSPSGSSPRRPPRVSRQRQQVEPVRHRRSGFGEQALSPDSPALLANMHEQARSPFEAPSFPDSPFEKGPIENRSRYSSTSLQGSVHDPFSDSPRNEHLDKLQQTLEAGSWHNQPADADYSGRSALRSRMEHRQRLPAAPGSPLVEHFAQDGDDLGPTLQQAHMLQNSGNDSSSVPWSLRSGSTPVDSFMQDSLTDFYETSHQRERPPLPVQDANKAPKSFAGLFKRSMRDSGKGGQGGNNRRKVVVNGHLIPEAAVRKAEDLAGPIHSGTYWYDYQAGFWGVMGGPCLGILMPFIEEFHFPLARDCAGGTTGILVNGRELNEKDLEVLAKRGMSTMSGKAYILDISGALIDESTDQPLRGLGKLAPSIEKRGRGFGMSQFTPQP